MNDFNRVMCSPDENGCLFVLSGEHVIIIKQRLHRCDSRIVLVWQDVSGTWCWSRSTWRGCVELRSRHEGITAHIDLFLQQQKWSIIISLVILLMWRAIIITSMPAFCDSDCRLTLLLFFNSCNNYNNNEYGGTYS